MILYMDDVVPAVLGRGETVNEDERRSVGSTVTTLRVAQGQTGRGHVTHRHTAPTQRRPECTHTYTQHHTTLVGGVA